MDHLVNIGPLAVSLAAGDWQHYVDGVFDGCDYEENIVINHIGQMVGYGASEAGEAYWIFRNSWGADWGMGGYMLLKRETEEPVPCGTGRTD